MNQPSTKVVRAALKVGVLTLKNQGWRFGRRQFAFKTVARLIASGEAVRNGNTGRAA